ncbi:MAG: hypothetical protein ABL888_19335, partial [Pirellulaceae bacterium]
LGEVGVAGTWVYLVALMIYYHRSSLVNDPAAKVFCYLVLFAFLLFGMVDHGLLDNRSFNILLGAAFGLQSIYAVSQPAQRMPINNRRQFVPVNDR